MRKTKQWLIIAIGALTIGIPKFDQSAHAADPINQLGRLVGAGWSDGYHSRKADRYRLGENLPPPSHAQHNWLGVSHQRYVDQYQSQTPSPAFGCSSCGGASVGSYHYAPSISGAIQHWQPSFSQQGPHWDGYEELELEPLESALPQPAVAPKAAVTPKAAFDAQLPEKREPRSPSDNGKASDDKPNSEEELLEDDDAVKSENQDDDELLLGPADKAWPPDLDASSQNAPSKVTRTVATRIQRASTRMPRKIGEDSHAERSEESNRPIRLPSSFR